LGAGWVDDLAGADDPRACRPPDWVWAGDVGRVWVGLSNGERRRAEPRSQQAGERTHAFGLRLPLFIFSKAISEELSAHLRFSFSWIFFIAQSGSACDIGGNTPHIAVPNLTAALDGFVMIG
jgi:hypothetical protein